MKKKLCSRVALLAVALFVPACIQTCETASSESVLTNGVGASLRVESTGASTDVAADLRVGGTFSNVYLDLAGTDKLTVSRKGQTVKLDRRTAPFGMVSYVTTLPGDSSGEEITVAFERSIDKGAPSSVVAMPGSFEIVSPAANSMISRTKDPIVVKWQKAEAVDPMSVTFSGSCIAEVTRTVEVDTGSLTLPPGTLKDPSAGLEPMERVDQAGGGAADAPEALRAPRSCKVTATLTRTRRGTLDPGYGQGGAITARQTRKVVFNSTP